MIGWRTPFEADSEQTITEIPLDEPDQAKKFQTAFSCGLTPWLVASATRSQWIPNFAIA